MKIRQIKYLLYSRWYIGRMRVGLLSHIYYKIVTFINKIKLSKH